MSKVDWGLSNLWVRLDYSSHLLHVVLLVLCTCEKNEKKNTGEELIIPTGLVGRDSVIQVVSGPVEGA